MNILVTGGAGFIGSHITDLLIENGHNVVIIDNLSSGKEKNINPKAAFYKMDIRDEKLDEIFEKENIDCIDHHAAQISVRKSTEDPIYDCQINIAGSLNLLQMAVKHNVKKFIFASTGGAIYGEQDYFPADEKHALAPISPYGVAKLSVEKYLHFYNLTYGINYTALRYANVYGPRQDPHGEAGVVAIFAKLCIKGDTCIINGDGTQTRDFTFVHDVARANLEAVNGSFYGSFNIGTSKETSVNELFDKLKTQSKSNSDRKNAPAKKAEQQRSVLSHEKILKEIGWKPGCSIDDGLKMTVEYFEHETN